MVSQATPATVDGALGSLYGDVNGFADFGYFSGTQLGTDLNNLIAVLHEYLSGTGPEAAISPALARVLKDCG